MMLVSIRYYILFTIFLLLLSCDDNGGIPIYGCLDPDSEHYCDDCTVDDGSCSCEVALNPEYTFDDDIFPALANSCTPCHFGSVSEGPVKAGLDFEIYALVEDRITKCNSDESLLFEKITTGNMATYANDDLVEMIETWISQGAP